jgi:hypothetical protein
MVKCILEDFKYQKKEGDVKEHSLLVLDNNENHRSGLDLSLLSEEEQGEAIQLQKNYEEKMTPFVKKAYRTFVIDRIVGDK